MEHIIENIKNFNLIKKGDTIGVAVSGGKDSMALLHYLSALQLDMDFEVVAIHVDHSLRPASAQDALFVLNYCKKNHIRAYKFKIDVKSLAEKSGNSIETEAREARYGVFESLIRKGIVDKVALAHHAEDQAETILLHLFRGSGLSGARGMEIKKKDIYIRPMLQTRKSEIIRYIDDYEIPFVEDETNSEDIYQRNFIRNKILPLINSRFPNAIDALNAFADSCKEDDDFISNLVVSDLLIVDDPKTVRIPCAYFINPSSLTSRLIFKALKAINVNKDIERKHVEMIKSLAISGQNGSKLKLPMDVSVYKDYDFLTISNEEKERIVLNNKFKCGVFNVDNFGKIKVSKAKNLNIVEGELLIDGKKLPSDAVWRYRKEGDIITKFGGGTQKLKTYLSQKKIPLRLRDFVPVLANDDEVFAVAGAGISDKVKVDDLTKIAYIIKVEK